MKHQFWIVVSLLLAIGIAPVQATQLAADAWAARLVCNTQPTPANWKKCRDLNKILLKEEPNNNQCKRCLWESYINLKQLDDAEAILRTMKPKDSNDHDFWGYWVITKLFEKDFKTALVFSDKAGKSARLNNEYYLFRADILHELKRYDDEVRVHNKRSDQKDLSWYLTKGKSGNQQTAPAAIRQLKELRPAAAAWLLKQMPAAQLSNDELVCLADAYATLSNTPQCMKTWKILLNRSPDDPTVVLPAISAFYNARQDLPSCWTNLKRIEGKCLVEPAYWKLRAGVTSLLENEVDSEASLNRAIALAPDQPEAYFSRSFFASSRKQYMEALRDLNKAIERKPDSIEYRKARMALYQRLKQYGPYIADCDYLVAHSQGKDKAGCLIDKSAAENNTGDLRASLRSLQQAKTLDPANAQIKQLINTTLTEMRACGLTPR